MEVVASVVGEALVAIGRVLCGSIYSMTKDTLKFQSNLDILEKEMKPLLALRDEVKNETEVAEIEGKVLRTQVIEWLKEVEELQPKVNQIQAVKLSQRSFNCSKRYRISKEVAEKLKEIEGLLKAGSSHSGAVAVNNSVLRAVQHVPGPTIEDQTTPSKTLDKTMTLLSNDEVRRIGIWGMGGVGKTTLVRNLNNKLESISSMQPFGIVIWVTVSKNLDMKNVQTEIAKRLDLKAKREDSMEQMAIRLYERLKKEKKFLLILDDVWKKIDLDNLGVPQRKDHKGSKIILTTRSFDVCRHMSTDTEVRVEVLNDEEAWQLFSETAGNVVSLEHIGPVAKEVARECGGLPLALVTMGAAMRKKTKVEQWKNALNELRRPVSCPPLIEDEIYKPLKWSYDSLKGKCIKSCFLYCSLFLEDFSIAISELAQYWLAEGLLDEQENYENSLNNVIALIETLKDSCLLEDGAHEGTIKMHDIVRDVAIWIASSCEDGCKSLVRSGIGLINISVDELSNSLKRVSFMNNKIESLPCSVVQCSKASTLLLQDNNKLRSVPEEFLQGFKTLRVLNVSGNTISSMPRSLFQLRELRTLLLRGCHCLPPFSLEGLTKLQVLDLSDTNISKLPIGMENLSNLKQLNLSNNYWLKTIQAGIISRLSCLEVLDMSTRHGYSFSVKRDVGKEMTILEEIKCLERLRVLHIRLGRIPILSDEERSCIDRLTQFSILACPMGEDFPIRYDERGVSIRGLDLCSEKWIGPLLRKASSLRLHNCLGLSDMLKDSVINSVGCFDRLKFLLIQGCSGSVWRGGCAAQNDLLPNLEELYLRNLQYGKSISEVLGHLGLRFRQLKSIQVEQCSEMEYLISYGDLIHALPNLQVFKVQDCNQLGELFSYHSMQNITPDPVVPNLQILELKRLPNLRTLCRDEETWPLLEMVYVFECALVRKLPLSDQNAENIKAIKGESGWWNTLKWHADTTESSLRPYFDPI